MYVLGLEQLFSIFFFFSISEEEIFYWHLIIKIIYD